MGLGLLPNLNLFISKGNDIKMGTSFPISTLNIVEGMTTQFSRKGIHLSNGQMEGGNQVTNGKVLNCEHLSSFLSIYFQYGTGGGVSQVVEHSITRME